MARPFGVGVVAAAELEAGAAGVLLPEPVTPPVAPEAAIRAAASASVVHAMEVPALLTRGRAAQVSDAPQLVTTNFPPTHWAKPEPTQACSPSGKGKKNQY